MPQTITYSFQDRDAAIAPLEAEGRGYEDVTIDLDENGRPTTCYFKVIDAPPAQDPTYEELLEAYNTATGGGPE